MSIQISGADQSRVEAAYSAMRECNELERALVIDRINRDTPKRVGRPRGSKNKAAKGPWVCILCENGSHGHDSGHEPCGCPCHVSRVSAPNFKERTEKLLKEAVAAQRAGDLGALMGEVDARIELELIEAERPE